MIEKNMNNETAVHFEPGEKVMLPAHRTVMKKDLFGVIEYQWEDGEDYSVIFDDGDADLIPGSWLVKI